jgi:protoporphyrin/coproporphyrin ferrochelatase
VKKLDYDAFLLVSFGGPNEPDEVMPFLENVTRGRHIPRERLEEVAEHYYHFGGKSPINEQNLALLEAIKQEIARREYDLPTFWGNRNWAPYFPDTLREIGEAGHKKVVTFFTSAYSSYSGCRQYRENLIAAQEAVGEVAPTIDKLRVYYNHPGFLTPMADGLLDALGSREGMRIAVLYAAHSIPNGMAAGCRYETQLLEASRLCGELAGLGEANWIQAETSLTDDLPRVTHELVYQSRSGAPNSPWLEPDICDQIRRRVSEGAEAIVVVPIGFISDHMEVLYDLDTEALELCQELGVDFKRVCTVGTDARFVSMVVDLIEERAGLRDEKVALGNLGPSHDVCPVNCCLQGATGRPMPSR